MKAKSNRSVAALLIAVVLSFPGFSRAGTEVGNPGDAAVFDFIRASREGLELLRQNFSQVPFIAIADFENSIRTANISATNNPLLVNGIEVDAINYPSQNIIVFSRPHWNAQVDRSLKVALAVHEHLGLIKVSDPNYAITFQILGDRRLPLIPTSPSKGAVDILFVIDDSGSMQSYQDNLARLAPAFFIPLEKGMLDYHIGVVTTTVENYQGAPRRPGSWGQLRNDFLTPNTKNSLLTFSNAILAGTAGSGVEQAFESAYLALTEPNLSQSNKDFYRPDANLEIIIVSDAEDQSQRSSLDMLMFLQSLKKNSKAKIRVHALTADGRQGSPACPQDNDGVMPVKVRELVKMTNGLESSLCSSTMEKDLEAVANAIVKQAP